MGGMYIKSSQKTLLVYTFAHFCVDFTCFYILFKGFRNSTDSLYTVSAAFLIYNVIAFGLQPLIGFYCDKKQNSIGVIGSVLVLSGLILIKLPWSSLVICALGNACFHVGGGIDSLVNAEGRMSRSGVFVSTGSLGVVFGTVAGKYEGDTFYIPLFLILSACILLFIFTGKEGKKHCSFDVSSKLPIAAVIVLMFIAIIVRSYVGGIIPASWKTTRFLSMLPGICAFAGKAAGGFLGDKFGAKTVGVSSLLLSVPLLILGNNNIFLSVSGIILFNIAMPITLCIIASKLPDNPGFSFGLTTLALLCGITPTFYFILPVQYVNSTLAVLILLAALCILISSKNNKRRKNNETNPEERRKDCQTV